MKSNLLPNNYQIYYYDIPPSFSYLSKGRTKLVYCDKNQKIIHKYFIGNIKIDSNKIQEEIDSMKKNMGKYIPDTSLKKDQFGNFFIEQEYIKGRPLKEVDINQLNSKQLSELIDLVKKYISHCKKENITTDFIGDQGKDNIFLAGIELIKCLPKNIFCSSNIVFGDDGHFYIVDVVDIERANNSFLSFLDKISQRLLKIFVGKTLKKMEKLKIKN